jgi:hypothetical protein
MFQDTISCLGVPFPFLHSFKINPPMMQSHACISTNLIPLVHTMGVDRMRHPTVIGVISRLELAAQVYCRTGHSGARCIKSPKVDPYSLRTARFLRSHGVFSFQHRVIHAVPRAALTR